MKNIAIIILLALSVGCSSVDKYGVTDEVYSEKCISSGMARLNLLNKIDILCQKNGYINFKVLSTAVYEGEELNKTFYIAKGVGRCIK